MSDAIGPGSAVVCIVDDAGPELVKGRVYFVTECSPIPPDYSCGYCLTNEGACVNVAGVSPFALVNPLAIGWHSCAFRPYSGPEQAARTARLKEPA